MSKVYLSLFIGVGNIKCCSGDMKIYKIGKE